MMFRWKFGVIALVLLLFGFSTQPAQALSFSDIFNFLKPSPQKLLEDANKKFEDVSSVHADMDGELTMMGVSLPNSNSTQTKMKITGNGDIRFNPLAEKMDMTISLPGMSLDMKMILLGNGEVYMQIPVLSSDWLSMDLNKISESSGVPFDPQANDYMRQSQQFFKAVKTDSIKKLGEEKIDGVDTTKVSAEIDSMKLAEEMRALQLGAVAEMYSGTEINTVYWIDKKGFPIQMEADIKGLKMKDLRGQQNSLGTADMRLKVKYSKFNQPVDIQKPEGNIVPFDQLQTQQPTTI